MNLCNGIGMRGWTFATSECDHGRNFRGLTVRCHDPDDESTIRSDTQFCAPHELCVGTGIPYETAKAYCIDTHHFIPIPRSDQQRLVHSTELRIPGSSEPFAAHAMLVDQSRSQGLAGASMFELLALEQFEQQSSDRIFKRQGPKERITGYVSCIECWSIGMEPVSNRTNLLRASVAIQNRQAGYLYLITIS